LRGQAALSFAGLPRQPGGGVLHPTRTGSASWRTNDSTNGFCHGEPGSINAVPALESTHQSLSACPVISGPLSHRRCAGAPRSAARASSTLTALSASMPRSTSILQRLTRELVYHVEQLDHLAVGGPG